MTEQQTQAMKLAREALESLKGFHICSGISCEGVITALTAALEQPAQQEPVAFHVVIDDEEDLALLRDMVVQSNGDLTPISLIVGEGHSGHGLYIQSADYPDEGSTLLQKITRPQAHEPLTDEQKKEMFCKQPNDVQFFSVFDAVVRLVEAHHGITGEKK